MKIKRGGTYRVKGKSKYFKDKYGTANPNVRIEDLAEKVWGRSWMVMQGNPTAMLYGMRAGFEGLPTDDKVWYGKIQPKNQSHGALAELFHESELEPC